MLIRIEHFRDVHTHASAVIGWQQFYSQLLPGNPDSALLQLSNDRIHIFRERFGQRIVQHGAAPRGKICFAIPMEVPGSLCVQGKNVESSSIFVLHGGQEFVLHLPRYMDILAITLDKQEFARVTQEDYRADDILSMLKRPVISVATPELERAKARILSACEEACCQQDDDGASTASGFLESTVIDALVCLCEHARTGARARHLISGRGFIVERCHMIAMTEPSTPPTVDDLSARLRVSRRTIQNAFLVVTQTKPNAYLKSIRLNQVRASLINTTLSDLNVSRAATDWGFGHFGHFSADYRKLFAELPSQTRRRS